MNFLETGPLSAAPAKASGMQRGYKETERWREQQTLPAELLPSPLLKCENWTPSFAAAVEQLSFLLLLQTTHRGTRTWRDPPDVPWNGTCPPAHPLPSCHASQPHISSTTQKCKALMHEEFWQGLLQMCILHWAVYVGLSSRATYKHFHILVLIYTQTYSILINPMKLLRIFFGGFKRTVSIFQDTPWH